MTLNRIVIWRHGQTEHNASGRFQGQLDTMLTDLGRMQAQDAVDALAVYQPSLVVSSDLRRALDTAKIFTETTGVPLRIDKRLRETYVGQWQGLTAQEVEDRWAGMIPAWRVDPTLAPPGGETRLEVAARSAEVIAELDAELDGTVLLCAHGGVVVALTAHLLNLPVELWPLLRRLGNCHWTVLDRRPGADSRWGLAGYNVGLG